MSRKQNRPAIERHFQCRISFTEQYYARFVKVFQNEGSNLFCMWTWNMNIAPGHSFQEICLLMCNSVFCTVMIHRGQEGVSISFLVNSKLGKVLRFRQMTCQMKLAVRVEMPCWFYKIIRSLIMYCMWADGNDWMIVRFWCQNYCFHYRLTKTSFHRWQMRNYLWTC